MMVERYRAYLNELEKQEEMPELELFEKLGLYRQNDVGSWLFRIGKNEEVADLILTSLAQDGRYPTGVTEAAAGRVRIRVGQRRREMSDLRFMYRVVKSFSKGLALLGSWGDRASVKDYLVSLGTTFGFWAIIDQVLAYPEEQILAQGILTAMVLQRAFLLPEERLPLRIEGIVLLTLGRQATDDYALKAQGWVGLLGEILDSGVPALGLYEVVKKRRYQWPVWGSVEGAEQAVMKEMIVELEELTGAKAGVQAEREMIKKSRLLRKQTAEKVLE